MGNYYMNYLSLENYKTLYAKYLPPYGRPYADLLDFDLSGKTVIDLCGGSGELLLEAKKLGAKKLILVEGDNNMVDTIITKKNNITVLYDDVEDFLRVPKTNNWKADLIVCRQSINYWLTPELIPFIISSLLEGGKFVFNTFNKPPSKVPSIKSYELNGLHYVESNQLIEDMVWYIQMCEHLIPHVHSFKWITPDEYKKWLNLFKSHNIKTFGNTDIHVCKN